MISLMSTSMCLALILIIHLQLQTHNETNPIWSGSGKHLAYTREIDGSFEVLKTTIFGEEPTSLGTFASDPTADWSKNEKWLLITDESSNGSVAVFSYEISTGKRNQLTFPPKGSYGDLEPTFSPTDEHVAFRRIYNEYVQDLFVLNLSDTTERRLAENNIRNIRNHLAAIGRKYYLFKFIRRSMENKRY